MQCGSGAGWLRVMCLARVEAITQSKKLYGLNSRCEKQMWKINLDLLFPKNLSICSARFVCPIRSGSKVGHLKVMSQTRVEAAIQSKRQRGLNLRGEKKWKIELDFFFKSKTAGYKVWFVYIFVWKLTNFILPVKFLHGQFSDFFWKELWIFWADYR